MKIKALTRKITVFSENLHTKKAKRLDKRRKKLYNKADKSKIVAKLLRKAIGAHEASQLPNRRFIRLIGHFLFAKIP